MIEVRCSAWMICNSRYCFHAQRHTFGEECTSLRCMTLQGMGEDYDIPPCNAPSLDNALGLTFDDINRKDKTF